MRANDLMPHPNAMFNIATDFEQIGKLREAAVWYQRYLDSAPMESPDRAKVAKNLAARPEQAGHADNPYEPAGCARVRGRSVRRPHVLNKPGTLTIRTNPPGVRAFVDDRFGGTSHSPERSPAARIA
jgi:hypothetical protein